MQRYVSRIGLVLAIVVTLATNRAGAAERPFKVSGDGAVLFNPQETPTGPFAASGHATHLGAWTNLGTITFAPLSDTTRLATGDVTFTAANGDQIDMVFHGVLDLATGHATATFVIVDGSGRFAEASGVSVMQLDQSPDGSFSFTLDGLISY